MASHFTKRMFTEIIEIIQALGVKGVYLDVATMKDLNGASREKMETVLGAITTRPTYRMPWGKYKGQTLQSIYESNPGYLRYFAKQMEEPDSNVPEEMITFIEVNDITPNPPKRRKTMINQ